MLKDKEIQLGALEFLKTNKKKIVEDYIKKSNVEPVTNPITFFMAGAPGAGKTEFAKTLISLLGKPFVRIDADEIRYALPSYDGKNSDLVQSACNLGVEKLYDFVLQKKYNCIMDSTFCNYDKQVSNIKRTLRRRRMVGIFFIYQNPVIAWDFTKKREKIEGRRVPKEAFIEKYFNSIETTNKIKEYFKDNVLLYFVEKNIDNTAKTFKINIDKVDIFIKNKYDIMSLDKVLRNVV
ncbi:zeta toxin family protein [Patescibacteria group bacterium]|nr:zeta toxin family protein [Patescibacteria group bacterium]